jgi:L-cysteate sulfo-lyase
MDPKFPEKVSLTFLPTPIEPLERLSRSLGGPEIWIKRDDQTGLATGGNKARKLEFLVADALAQGADHLVTTGAPQSNHARQTAAAAARYGLGCSLVLRGRRPETTTGNLLLDELFGAHVYWCDLPNCPNEIGRVMNTLRSIGLRPYFVPLGGSNVIGATGYVMAMRELTEQMAAAHLNFDFIVFASSSGGTQAGLVVGARAFGFRGTVLGISVDHPAESLQTQVAALATATATHIGLDALSVADLVSVNDDYVGEGYARVGETEREAIHMMAQIEGILLDPVYTGRAFGGLIDLIRWGAFTRGQRVLFWHTGGTAALPAFADRLL